MSFKWKYRAYPGPTASHLWGPKDTHSLCGKMKRSVGEWKTGAPPATTLCLLCSRKRERLARRDRQRSIKPGRAVRAPFSIYVIVDAMGRIVSSAFAQPTYLELQAKSVRGERIVQYVLVGSGK